MFVKGGRMQMVEKKVTVQLKTGLQARPAAIFVQTANSYSSEVFFIDVNLFKNKQICFKFQDFRFQVNQTLE